MPEAALTHARLRKAPHAMPTVLPARMRKSCRSQGGQTRNACMQVAAASSRSIELRDDSAPVQLQCGRCFQTLPPDITWGMSEKEMTVKGTQMA